MSAYAKPGPGLALSLVTLLLSGCATGLPPGTAALALPATWSGMPAGSPATSLALWWSRFDDPMLTSLVERALLANTRISNAEAALRQARALRDVAAAGLWPNLGSSATAQRQRSGGNAAANAYSVGLDASWEVDIFGARRSALSAGEATAAAAAASLGDVQISIAAEVALAYISLRGSQTRLAIAESNLASQQEILQITGWRLQAGLVTSLEAEQARAATEQTLALLPAWRSSIEQNRHALAVLTGQPPTALALELAGSGPLPRAADDLILNIPAETLRQRPDVRAAELQVSAAQARVAAAEAARAPNFKLGGNLGLAGLSLGALNSGTSVVSGLLASVTLPLFDGGALRAQVRAQEAALDQAQSAYHAAVLTALQEVENGLIALQSDRERRGSLQNAAEAAGNAALLARQRYGSGLVDFQVVLETQRSQFSSQDAVAGVLADISADHVRLYKALGGAWQPAERSASLTADIP